MNMRQCTICRCASTTEIFGFRVCAYHALNGEDGPPCPTCGVPEPSTDTWYDYDNQAWVMDGRYAECGHHEKVKNGRPCCFAGAHAGETVRQNARRHA